MKPTEQQKPSQYWTTQNGDRLLVSEMSTSHIQNCIHQLKSQMIDTWAVHGDEPKYGAGGYSDTVMHDFNDRLEAKISQFEAELKKRGVK